MGRIGAWFGGSTTGMKALVALACVVVLLASGCSAVAAWPSIRLAKGGEEGPRTLAS